MIRLALILALALGIIHPAHAHKMRMFATAEGAMIFARAYFSAESPAVGVSVQATTVDGRTVFTGRTDADGRFRFEAAARVDHELIADGGDGHQARFTIHAAELAPTLPAESGVSTAPVAPPPLAVPPVPASDDLAALVDAAVARHVAPLREELANHEDSVRWHDVIGGLGYIIGLGGLAYGLSVSRSGTKSGKEPHA